MFYRLYELLWEYDDPGARPGLIVAGRANKRAIVGSTILFSLLILSLPFIYLLLKQII